jgi:hypothetical protein
VFTALYALSPYIKQIHFVFKGLILPCLVISSAVFKFSLSNKCLFYIQCTYVTFTTPATSSADYLSSQERLLCWLWPWPHVLPCVFPRRVKGVFLDLLCRWGSRPYRRQKWLQLPTQRRSITSEKMRVLCCLAVMIQMLHFAVFVTRDEFPLRAVFKAHHC